MTIGERIKSRRNELGLTQTELAKRMGLTSKTTICKAETKDFNPTTDRIREFAKALDVSPAYLMGWETIPEIGFETKDSMDKLFEIEKVDTKHTSEALELYEKYLKADPNVKMAIETLLKGKKED